MQTTIRRFGDKAYFKTRDPAEEPIPKWLLDRAKPKHQRNQKKKKPRQQTKLKRLKRDEIRTAANVAYL